MMIDKKYPDVLIQTTGLTRKFDRQTVVDQLSLNVPAGSVYGFLGPNGAGKTTTIRMLLGLIRPDAGEVSLFGKPLRSHRLEVLRQVSALVESPSLYPQLTGGENLEVTRRMLGLPRQAIDRALGMAGILDVKNRLVRAYSLGMKQRLALAMALMPEPTLLILDEPTNGLDPEGILDVRELIAGLPKNMGTTVFLSSHLLSEVEQVATHIGIINHGKLLFEGSLSQLQAERQQYLLLASDRPEQARELATRNGWRLLPGSNGRLKLEVNGPADAALVNRQLVQDGVNVHQLELVQPSLEDIFMTLTKSPVG
ncbi:MAG: ATP-binding cassette domain-containing protein [Anaerolineaceae bacterium]|nr:ATP-binding cassette domain-containing protein [Anaerolineaceae bacterium]